MKSTVVVLVFALAAAGCRWEQDAEARFVNAMARAKEESADPYGLGGPRGHSPFESTAPDPDDSDPDSLVVSGRIAETMNAVGYTYIRIATRRGDVWAAVPETELHVGDPVTVDGQLTMENFESKTLKRTFDRIIFGTIAGSKPLLPDEPTTATAVSIAAIGVWRLRGIPRRPRGSG